MIHFYHLFCYGNNWEKIVISHFNFIKKNKLVFEKTYVGLIGDETERAKEILFNLQINNLIIVNEKQFGVVVTAAIDSPAFKINECSSFNVVLFGTFTFP